MNPNPLTINTHLIPQSWPIRRSPDFFGRSFSPPNFHCSSSNFRSPSSPFSSTIVLASTIANSPHIDHSRDSIPNQQCKITFAGKKFFLFFWGLILAKFVPLFFYKFYNLRFHTPLLRHLKDLGTLIFFSLRFLSIWILRLSYFVNSEYVICECVIQWTMNTKSLLIVSCDSCEHKSFFTVHCIHC